MKSSKHSDNISTDCRGRLMLSSCSTDQFYNYSTKVTLREIVSTDPGGPLVPFIVMRHVSFAATETEGIDSGDCDDIRTLVSEPGVSCSLNTNAFPLLTIGRRAGSCGRLTAVNPSDIWTMRGRRMAIDMGTSDHNDGLHNEIILGNKNDVNWRRGRRMAIDLSAMCDETIVDVDQIVGTGGIMETYTTDTDSEDSVTACLQPSPISACQIKVKTATSNVKQNNLSLRNIENNEHNLLNNNQYVAAIGSLKNLQCSQTLVRSLFEE